MDAYNGLIHSHILRFQRPDSERLIAIHHQVPIGHQFLLVQFCPGLNEFSLSRWKGTVDDLSCTDINRRFGLAVERVEVRRIVFALGEIQSNAVNIDMVGIFSPLQQPDRR